MRFGGAICWYSDPRAQCTWRPTLSEPFPQDDPEEQAEFLRNRLFDRLADCREDGPISAADLRLLLGLLDGTDRPSRRAAVIAEIGVTERLLALGAQLRVEVPNPEGRSADLEVLLGSTRFFLHLKRLPDPKTESIPQDAIPEIMKKLEGVPRPYRVGVRVQRDLNSDTLKIIVTALREFLLGARMGDRRIIRDKGENELAAAVVIAPTESGHVELAPGAIDRAASRVERAHRLLRRAYQQFVPALRTSSSLSEGGITAGKSWTWHCWGFMRNGGIAPPDAINALPMDVPQMASGVTDTSIALISLPGSKIPSPTPGCGCATNPTAMRLWWRH